jgi:pimeloyl-ACP methyl ester carboxylesterase
MTPPRVVLLPGIVMPANLRYAALASELGGSASLQLKELEVYSGDQPPPGYRISTEVEGITAVADAAGWKTFHLYGHSGGGACTIAYAHRYPERVLSLAVDEPATDFSADASAYLVPELKRIQDLPPGERFASFVRLQLAPGVEPPPRPPGPTPDWMAKRPRGIEAFTDAVAESTESTVSSEYRGPVYFSYGGLSNPYWEQMAGRLAGRYLRYTAERYEGAHHFNTSHQHSPERVAAALRNLWASAE